MTEDTVPAADGLSVFRKNDPGISSEKEHRQSAEEHQRGAGFGELSVGCLDDACKIIPALGKHGGDGAHGVHQPDPLLSLLNVQRGMDIMNKHGCKKNITQMSDSGPDEDQGRGVDRETSDQIERQSDLENAKKAEKAVF